MAIYGRYTGISLAAPFMSRRYIHCQVFSLSQVLSQVVVSGDWPRRFRSSMPHPLTRPAVLPKALIILGLVQGKRWTLVVSTRRSCVSPFGGEMTADLHQIVRLFYPSCSSRSSIPPQSRASHGFIFNDPSCIRDTSTLLDNISRRHQMLSLRKDQEHGILAACITGEVA